MLRINFDETSICLFQGGGRGNVFLAKDDRAACQRVARGVTRTRFTCVAFICDDPRVQTILPQVFVLNEHTITLRQMADLRASCPPHVTVLRRTSAWVDEAMALKLVGLLRDALLPVAGGIHPVLLFDAYRSHTTPRVWRACAAAGIWAALVPAKLTSVIQPLDTHAFQKFKVCIQRGYQQARLRTADGGVDVTSVVSCAVRAIDRVLHGELWADAFDRDGFSAGQRLLSERVKARLEIEGDALAASTKPTLEQLRLCFPKRSKVPSKAIWHPHGLPPPPPPKGGCGGADVAPPRGAGLRRSTRISAKALSSTAYPLAAAPMAPPHHVCGSVPEGGPTLAHTTATSSGVGHGVAPMARGAAPTAAPKGPMTRARARAAAE